MKKWMGLLLAGALVSAFLVGCNKEPEGSTTTNTTTSSKDGKMETKTSPEPDAPKTGG